MKLDASLGVEGKNLQSASATARAAESLGFAGLWSSETRHDSFLPLAIAADVTGVSSTGTRS
jgi:alkanesulfonate monooxygenase SsuD/methylene tetrahydromethanopterin reductase-like flavin-dependent oxidoreductase (luciferase family)